MPGYKVGHSVNGFKNNASGSANQINVMPSEVSSLTKDCSPMP